MTTLTRTEQALQLDDAVSCLREYRRRLRSYKSMPPLRGDDPLVPGFDLDDLLDSLLPDHWPKEKEELAEAANALEATLAAVEPVDDSDLTETIELVRSNCRVAGIGAELYLEVDIFDLLDKVEEGLIALRKAAGKTRYDLPDPIPNTELAAIIKCDPDYLAKKLRDAVDPKKAKPPKRSPGQRGLEWWHKDLDCKVQYLHKGKIKKVLLELGFRNPNQSS